jgi:hypothetical protein
MTLPPELIVYHRRPMKVTFPVAPSNAIIHQVMKRRPNPNTNPHVSAKAITLSFILDSPKWNTLPI